MHRISRNCVETCESGTLPASGRMVRSLAADAHLSEVLNQIVLEIARVAQPKRISLCHGYHCATPGSF